MARNRTRHSRRGGSGFNRGYLLWGFGLIIFIAIIAFMFFQPEKTNLSDFCPRSGEKGKIVILLDVSDPLNMSQKAVPIPKFSQEYLYEVFKQQDKNSDGILEEHELFAALQKLGLMSLEWC